MSRRSAETDRELERERERDDYASSSSYHFKPTREYEPGELRGSEWGVERDPWNDPAAGPTSRRSHSPRNREGERDTQGVTFALEGFSRLAFVLQCRVIADG
jgi:hypothetical protein